MSVSHAVTSIYKYHTHASIFHIVSAVSSHFIQCHSLLLSPVNGSLALLYFTKHRPRDKNVSHQEKKMMTSGKTSTKRSVSETKKKYVASQQGWKCGKCHQQLPAWFEVDHTIRLEYGGTNEVNNLVALCRECHGQKTAMENM